jgi:hypothetical protein
MLEIMDRMYALELKAVGYYNSDELLQRLASIQLVGVDEFRWNLTKKVNSRSTPCTKV